MVGVADRRATNAEGLLGIFYVLDYGATGDGQHDDAGGIQAAINAAGSAGGGLVAIPPGGYRLGSAVVWGAATNVTLWQHSGASFTGPGTLPAAAGGNAIRVEPSGATVGGAPTTQAFGDTPAPGATGTAADVAHRHGMPVNATNANLAADVARANLFVNGGFEVAQRPGAPWTANGVFTLDYWRQDLIAAGSTISTSQITSTIGSPGKSAQIVYTHVAASGYRFTQPVRLADNLDQLRGKQVTFGFQVKSTVAGTVRCVANGTILGIVTGAYNVGIAEETIQLTVTIPANETGLFLGVQFDVATATVELNDARHVIGAVLPNYAPLPAADDTARCRRYYQRWTGTGMIATGQGSGGATSWVVLPLTGAFGGAPTLTVSAAGDWSLLTANGGTQAVTALALGGATAQAVALTITSAAIVAGNATILLGANAASWLALEWNPA